MSEERRKKWTYHEIDASQKHRSWTSYIFKRFSILLVYCLQGFPLTPNGFTVISLLLVAGGVTALVVFGNWILCIVLLWLSFNFDQVDGIWARIKNQGSKFGAFFDPYTDEIKDHLIDLGFILYYFSRLQELMLNLLLLVFLMALLFILKASYYAARNTEPSWVDLQTDLRKVRKFSYGGAEKYMFVYPLLALSYHFFVFYLGVHLVLYFLKIIQILRQKNLRLALDEKKAV